MTEGASQGLYVVVGIVIFGIFLGISYLLFRDKMQTEMGSIYSDSLNQTMDDLNTFTTIKLTDFDVNQPFLNSKLKLTETNPETILIYGYPSYGVEQLSQQFNVEKGKTYRVFLSYKINAKVSDDVNGTDLQGAYFLFYEGEKSTSGYITNTNNPRIIHREHLSNDVSTEYITTTFDYKATKDKINIVLSFSGVKDGTFYNATFKDFKMKVIF